MASPRQEAQGISPAPGRVQAVSVAATLTLLVRGRLDDVAGSQLLDAVAVGLVPGISRIDVDLRDVDEFTEDGAASLVRVKELGVNLPNGVHYRSAAGAGGDAFLAAFAAPDTD